jgi:hypothetical protein
MGKSFISEPFGLQYVDGSDIKEGDLAWFMEAERVTTILFFYDASSFSFKMKSLNKRIGHAWPLHAGDERSYHPLGSMYDDPALLPLWKMAGSLEGEGIFMFQGETSTCFPLAAMNACIGAGVEKADLNFDLLKRACVLGECRKWGGCIDEQAVLNLIQAELEVSFVLDEYESTIETGGIVTVKEGGFHAVASVVHEGQSFLVNMMDGPFVRPARVTSLGRSENPSHHRDYTLLTAR